MKETYSNIFIFGMFRSATTMLARALSAHSEIKIASDPYFQFFKSFRNEIYTRHNISFDTNSPLSDNFFNENLELDKIILNSSYDFEIKKSSLKEIISQIEIYIGRDSEKIKPLLNEVEATNFRDLLRELIFLVYKSYGDISTNFVGFKSTFAELFIAPTIRALPNSKVICVVRDPRAIFASQIFPKKDYPILYVVRQWRKSIEYILQNISEKNVYVLRYEDLVDDPKSSMNNISKFIGVTYQSNMIDPKKFKDGGGGLWSKNSSYNENRKKNVISNKNKNRWADVLSQAEIQIIEDLCDAEMKIFGYKRQSNINILNLKNTYVEDKDEFRNWFREFFYQYELNEIEIKKEIKRYHYLKNKKFDEKNLEKFLVKATSQFLEHRVFLKIIN